MLKPSFKLLTRKTSYNYPKFRRRSSLRSTPSVDHDVNLMVKKQRIIPELPVEILAEILKRLQVKYILRCMLVQKSWYHLIKSPLFLKLHLEYEEFITHKYLFFENYFDGTFTVRYDDVQCEEYCKFRHLPGLPTRHFWYLTSNGLVCVSRMFNKGKTCNPIIYLWNPLIQKYKTLPDSPLRRFIPLGRPTLKKRKWHALAFGFVPEVSDYVVVHIVKHCMDSVMIGVYSLNADSWKIRRHDDVTILSVRHDNVVFNNGAAFWLGLNLEGRGTVMCFDTKTDILRVISLPALANYELGNPVIHPSGQSIAYFTEVFEDDESEDEESFLDMWVLEDDQMNEESSWVKKMRVNFCIDNLWGPVLGVRNNGEPIIVKEYNFVTYDLDNHEANDFVSSWNHWTPFAYCDMKNNLDRPFNICPYVESLVLLDTD
ncbi:F-box domain-containing protein [Heracleum sosnowskyi]|uniref:F-box domain-containing protein n=1 Tax=Heracleum sosnowskyi TaxID=360622 RepID=A0AAD8HRG5_9APIA|nr:F-box domain-containing protein [Heracleum sosnowskyi]